jgi:hypothetical protein
MSLQFIKRVVLLGLVMGMLSACASYVTAPEVTASAAIPAAPTGDAPLPTASLNAPEIPTETLYYQTDFSNPAAEWLTGEQNGVSGAFLDGEYELRTTADGVLAAVGIGQNLQDVQVEVNAALQGDIPALQAFGPVCRMQDADNYYRFMIGADGYYGIYKIRNGERVILSDRNLQPGSVKTGAGQVNRITADCVGSLLTLSVNGQVLLQVQDSAYARGDIGLAVSAAEAGLTVRFDDFLARPAAPTTLQSTPGAPPAAGETVYSDDFSTPRRTETKDSVTFRTVDRTFQILIDRANWEGWKVLGSPFDDQVVEVDMAWPAGGGDRYGGVICLLQDDQNFYELIIGMDGYAGVVKVQDGTYYYLAQSQGQTRAIVTDEDALNQLRADCAGGRLTLYVNGEKAIEALDDSFQSGIPGVVGGALSAPGTDLRFSNFKVSQP